MFAKSQDCGFGQSDFPLRAATLRRGGGQGARLAIPGPLGPQAQVPRTQKVQWVSPAEGPVSPSVQHAGASGPTL